MRVEFVEGAGEISKLRSQWQNVYEADPEANYFLTFDWLFGTPDGAGRNAIVVAASDPSANRYVSFLPLRLNTEHENGSFHNELNLCGNYNSDYTGFLCQPGFEDQAIPALAANLRHMNWRRLRLLNFAASERRKELFLKSFPSDVLGVKELNMLNPDGTDNAICPHVPLTQDWDEFLRQNLSSNTRQKVRRLLRQIEGSEGYRITHTTDETRERDVETLIRLWSDRWGEIKGKRLGAIQKSLRRMLNHAAETDSLFMPVLWHENRVICIHGIFTDPQKKAYNFYVGARDLSFKGPSVGMALHAYAMRRAISEGMLKYDFLRGNEDYKYAFGSKESRITSLLVSSTSGKNIGGKLDRRGLNYVKRRAAGFYRAGDLEHAARACAQVLQLDPQHRSSLYLRGVAAARLGQSGIACRAFSELLKREPESIKTWMRLGRAVIADYDNWNEAVRKYGSLLRGVPDQSRVPVLLGRVLLKLGEDNLGAAVLEATLRRKPEDTATRSAIKQHVRRDRLQSAVRSTEASLAIA